MNRTWLGIFEVTAQISDALTKLSSSSAAAGGHRFAVEIRCLGASGCVLLLSKVADETGSLRLQSLFGLSNRPKIVDRLCDEGLRVVDAQITVEPDSARVLIPPPRPAPQGGASLVIVLSGLSVEPAAAIETLDVQMEGCVTVPDLAQPDSELRVADVVSQRRAEARATRFMIAMDGLQPLVSVRAWQLEWQVDDPAHATETQHAQPSANAAVAAHGAHRPGHRPDIRHEPRAKFFAPPAFRFKDVELIGFRIDADQLGLPASEVARFFDELAEPLNFHLCEPSGAAASDFRYRCASRTLIVELARYGHMRLDAPTDKLLYEWLDDQCQHELLVRVLVGRVDDDTAQARDPAVYVPAIFVDNPWSRMLGREVQGFDKGRALFCTEDCTPLLSDGRRPRSMTTEPLGRVRQVRLPLTLGALEAADTTLSQPMLAVDYTVEVDRPQYVEVDPGLVLCDSPLSALSWRQTDFEQMEFRRSFARQVLSNRTRGFRSIQVSPVRPRRVDEDTRQRLGASWIGGEFTLEKVGVEFPDGLAKLRFDRARNANGAWNKLAALIAQLPGSEISLPSGDWYRLRCDMTLKVDDGLSW